MAQQIKIKVGYGYDVHRLEDGLDLYLGGIKVEHVKGCVAHSDGDVLIHAICDALLGAANMRDIGYHFPDTSAEYKKIDSKILLRKTVSLIRAEGWEISNVDSTICMERPKINPHIPTMQACLADVMGISAGDISIKATTSEKLGFVGTEQGVAVHAVALLIKQ